MTMDRNFVGGAGGPLFSGAAAETRPHLDVAALTAEARAEYAAGVADFERGVEHFRRMGLVLKKLKAVLPHGAFTPHLKKHMPCGERQCRRYLELAEMDAGADLREKWAIICGHDPAKRTHASVLGPDAEGDPDGQAEGGEGSDSPAKRSSTSVLGPGADQTHDAAAGAPPVSYQTDDDVDTTPVAPDPADDGTDAGPDAVVPTPEGTGPDGAATHGTPRRREGESGPELTAAEHYQKAKTAFGAVCRALHAVGHYDQLKRSLDAIAATIHAGLRKAGAAPCEEPDDVKGIDERSREAFG
jgi:hypothetical protein